MAPASNVMPCGGYKNENNGCMEIFPRATPGELCQRCQKIHQAPTAAQKKELEETLKSCEGCGLCASTLKHNMCGTCRKLELQENGQEDLQAAAARKARHDRVQRSFGGPLQNVVNQPLGVSTPIQELEHLKSASQKGMWTIVVHPYRGQAKDKEMGKGTFIMAGETPMSGKSSSNSSCTVFALLTSRKEVTEKIATHYNRYWTAMKDHPLNLRPDDYNLRFSGNINMDPATHDMTLQELYTFYQQRPDRAVVNVDTKLKLPKGTSMAFEFYIKDKVYMERVWETMEDSGESTGSKRKRATSSLQLESKHVKSGTGSVLISSFNPNDDYSALSKRPNTFKIVFDTIHCEPAGNDGKHVLRKDSLSRTGAIEVNPLILSLGDRGKSKDVHKFKIDGDSQLYVAKKLFDIGKGRGVDVTPACSKSVLSRDLTRLRRLAWFREGFFRRASDKGLNELAEFMVSDGFLILVQNNDAMDVTELDADDNNDDKGDTYLIEPLRATSVVNKFTGTFGASHDTDKLTYTILAFNHFILQDTACLLAYADLQGSRHKGQMVLFDPMTHTIQGQSGTGDFGPKGIRDTINAHTCNLFCKTLELSPVGVLLDSLEVRIKEDQDALVSHQSDDELSEP
ncbi:kinase-like domain-containing protein [Mycena sanguinolenta]|nr:kinase-like domain-containing protein [Mycena sanguinolenta]